MRAAWSLVLVAAAGCGRLRFTEAVPGDGAPGGDGANPGDGAAGDAQAVACSELFDICDGFEEGLDTSLWMTDVGVTRDTTFAHRGSASIRVQTPAFGPSQDMYRALAEAQTIASGATTFWVRGWYWLSALPAGNNGMELVTAERPGDQGNYMFVYADRSTVYSQFDDVSRGTDVVPVASWFCLVFKVVRSTAANGSLELSGDVGPAVLPDVVTDSSTSPITEVQFGIGFASPNVPDVQPALELWIDDVIVHSAPVTCSD